MTLNLADPVVTALAARLTSDLDAAVAAFNTTVTDDGVLDPGAQVLDYVPPITTLGQFPTVGIQHGAVRWLADRGSSGDVEIDVELVVIVQNADPSTLAKIARRHVAVVLDVAIAGRTLGTAAYGLRPTGIDYGPMLAQIPGDNEPPRGYVTFAVAQLTALRDE